MTACEIITCLVAALDRTAKSRIPEIVISIIIIFSFEVPVSLTRNIRVSMRFYDCTFKLSLLLYSSTSI